MLTFRRTDSDDKDFRDLVELLDAELKIRDGADHSFYSQYNKIDAIRNVIVCYDQDVAVGCGAFRQFETDTVEIKRMYVKDGARSKGIGHLILKELEKWAAELNFNHTILETGKKQHEAIKLYHKAGYQTIPNYGQYANVDNSICMKKAI
jgi:putative acetyltransferase